MISGSRNGSPRPAPAGRGPAIRHQLEHNPYGLTLAELRAEMRRCAARGWQLWELRRRFATTGKDHIE